MANKTAQDSITVLTGPLHVSSGVATEHLWKSSSFRNKLYSACSGFPTLLSSVNLTVKNTDSEVIPFTATQCQTTFFFSSNISSKFSQSFNLYCIFSFILLWKRLIFILLYWHISQCKLSQKFDVDYEIQYWAFKMYYAATNTLKAHSVIPSFTVSWTQREEL